MISFLRQLLVGGQPSAPGLPSALAQFQKFETELHADFFALAAQSGMPRGLTWTSCEWPGPLRIVADPASQLITAFASVNIGFEAIEGGDMEGVAAVSTIRDGSAVFHFQNGAWGSAGRVIFNMAPVQAAEHLLPDADVVFERAQDGR